MNVSETFTGGEATMVDGEAYSSCLDCLRTLLGGGGGVGLADVKRVHT